MNSTLGEVTCKNTFIHVVPVGNELPPVRRHRRSTAPPDSFNVPGGDLEASQGAPPETLATASAEQHQSDSAPQTYENQQVDDGTHQASIPPSDVFTVMVRGIPCSCTQEEILDAIDEVGFKGKHDFFYIPSRHSKYLGYAFVGFPDSQLAEMFTEAMTGYRFRGRKSPKVVTVVPAHIQGREQNLQHFKGTFVMQTERSPLFDAQDR